MTRSVEKVAGQPTGWWLRCLIGCLVLVVAVDASACTTAVVSGRATPDGRPLLWKTRDTSNVHNQVVYRTDGKYRYVGVINSGAKDSVFMGVNEAGFCIENSLSKDLSGDSKAGPGNGGLMKLALETCATVADFERLLEETNVSGRRTNGNFGVIDARGGAAIFEAGNKSFVKFDANDPQTAPDGYVVRANFSMTSTGQRALSESGTFDGIYSAERYCRAEALISRAAAEGRLDHRFILRHCCRDLADPDGRPHGSTVNGDTDEPLPEQIDTAATLSRRTTVSAAVFQGVRPGEDPLLTTMWTILGEPAFSVAVPCWVRTAEVAPELLGDQRSPLCSLAIDLRTANYETATGPLLTARLPMIWSQTWPVEDRLFTRVDKALEQWRGSTPDIDEVRRLHRSAARNAHRTLQSLSEQFQPAAVAQ